VLEYGTQKELGFEVGFWVLVCAVFNDFFDSTAVPEHTLVILRKFFYF
jgi:hypothetical protein